MNFTLQKYFLYIEHFYWNPKIIFTLRVIWKPCVRHLLESNQHYALILSNTFLFQLVGKFQSLKETYQQNNFFTYKMAKSKYDVIKYVGISTNPHWKIWKFRKYNDENKKINNGTTIRNQAKIIITQSRFKKLLLMEWYLFYRYFGLRSELSTTSMSIDQKIN